MKKASRLNNLSTESFWDNMDKLCLFYKPVNLGKGFPNWKPPKFITDAACKAISDLDFNQYTRLYGYPQLTEQIALTYSKELGRTIDSNDEVLISVGALGSLYCAFQAFLNPGDQVLVFEPYFNLYKDQINISGGELIGLPLEYKPSGDLTKASTKNFNIDFDKFNKLITPKTKMILLNTPHNPTGKNFSKEEIEKICNIVKKHNLILVSDEVYERMTLNDLPHLRPASFKEMYDRTITIGSAGKSFSVTGWKLGWSIGPSTLIEPMKKIHLLSAASIGAPFQYALTEAFIHASKSNYYQELCETLKENCDLISKAFIDIGLKPIIPDGSYMMLIDFSKFILPNESEFYDNDEPLDWKICKQLIAVHGLATIPTSPFYSQNNKKYAGAMIRICFCKTKDVVEKAIIAINKLKPHIREE